MGSSKYVITIFSFTLIFLVGCRKEYTCKCTAKDETYNESHTSTMTKKAAEDWCIDKDNEKILQGEEIEGWKCELVE